MVVMIMVMMMVVVRRMKHYAVTATADIKAV
jgi:hypothetical protein